MQAVTRVKRLAILMGWRKGPWYRRGRIMPVGEAPRRIGSGWTGRDLGSGQAQDVGKERWLGNLSTPKRVQKLQRALHAKAKAEPGFRFYALYDRIDQ